MTPKESIKLIEEYEGENIWEVWGDSTAEDREYGYIIKPEEIIKIVGTSRRIKSPELLTLDDEDMFFHTHPGLSRARLSSTDIVFMLYHPIKGMGVIAGDEVKCWRLPKDIRDQLYAERRNLIEKWKEAYLRDDASACFHYRAKVGANTRKARETLELIYKIDRSSYFQMLIKWQKRQRKFIP